MATLFELDRWVLAYGGSIARFDIAFELTPARDDMTIAELTRWITRSVILKWRPAGPSLSYEDNDNFYWVQQSARTDGRKSARDAVAYERKSKLDPSGKQVCELELRFERADSVAREYVHLPSELLALNPRNVFEKHLKIVDHRGIAAIQQEAIRGTLHRERLRFHVGDAGHLSDQYRASLHLRAEGIWQRAFQGRAQALKDRCPLLAKRLKRLIGSISVPDYLQWPDQHQGCIDISVSFSGNASSSCIDMGEGQT